jgi:hypothetical protein
VTGYERALACLTRGSQRHKCSIASLRSGGTRDASSRRLGGNGRVAEESRSSAKVPRRPSIRLEYDWAFKKD